MIEALIVLLWPVGVGTILTVTAFWARSRRSAPVATAPMNGHGASEADATVRPRSARSSIIGLLLILAVGAFVVYALTALLGLLVMHAGPAIDEPIYRWTIQHQVPFWTRFMYGVTEVGGIWTSWGAAAVAAVCLAAFYRRNKWLPPVVLGAAIVFDQSIGLALRHTFERPGLPESSGGAFPSGGCDCIVLVYGLVAYLICRELGGNKRTTIWAAGVVGALAFSQAYSCGYLTLHWFTDIISGLVYGTLVLVVFIVTIWLVDGPARKVVAEVSSRFAVSGQHGPKPVLPCRILSAWRSRRGCTRPCGRTGIRGCPRAGTAWMSWLPYSGQRQPLCRWSAAM